MNGSRLNEASLSEFGNALEFHARRCHDLTEAIKGLLEDLGVSEEAAGEILSGTKRLAVGADQLADLFDMTRSMPSDGGTD
jgi:hypothetical protein